MLVVVTTLTLGAAGVSLGACFAPEPESVGLGLLDAVIVRTRAYGKEKRDPQGHRHQPQEDSSILLNLGPPYSRSAFILFRGRAA